MTLQSDPDRGEEFDSGKAVQLLTLTCGVCANVRFFSAKMVGIVNDHRTPVTAKLPRNGM
jgi:hypothetical protein